MGSGVLPNILDKPGTPETTPEPIRLKMDGFASLHGSSPIRLNKYPIRNPIKATPGRINNTNKIHNKKRRAMNPIMPG